MAVFVGGTMIKLARRAEAERVLSGMTLGFSADPFMRWLYPETHQFLEVFPRVLDLHGGAAFDHDGAFCNDDFTAGALWLPPGAHPDEEGLMACFAETLAPEKHEALFATFERMGAAHPVEPCWHLAMVSVDPAKQGQGQGSALMSEGLAACDRAGSLAYLESTDRANLTLYRRCGFEEIGAIELPGAPPIFPMLRSPR
jgi:GNAT superfamily N-acetyltransferase